MAQSRKKKPVKESPEESPDFTEYDENLPSSFHEAASEWVDTIRNPDEAFTVTLYKYVDKVKNKKEYCYQWVDEIPSPHDIGIRFGGGRYRLYVTFVKSEFREKHILKSYMFNVHEHYDKLKEDKINNVPVQSGVQAPSVGSAQNLDSAFMMFQKVITLLLPLIVNQRAGDGEGNFSGHSEMMLEHHKTMSELMRKNFIEQQKLYGKMLTNETYQDEPGPEEPEGGGFGQVLQTVIPLVEQFFTQLSGTDPNSRSIQEAVKNNPQFQALTKNKNDFNKVLEYLIKQHGKKEVVKILNNLGIKFR